MDTWEEERSRHREGRASAKVLRQDHDGLSEEGREPAWLEQRTGASGHSQEGSWEPGTEAPFPQDPGEKGSVGGFEQRGDMI